ncbi:MAG: LLM class F420-dependent oxidoreductase [Acidimicrobiia bacterium]|nr:MAG: LLM class F420-dependent oxidoreductase [Acidimicrobiia bacterium]
MRLGINLGYWGTAVAEDSSIITEVEKLGYDSVWTAEAYGADALTPLAFLAARTETIKLGAGIMQMPARSPAMTAMTAATIDQMSNGRFLLGLGVSGPQVVEGWHGRPYGKPLGLTREYVTIVRKALARDEPVTFDGEHYQIPYRGEGATGLGKPLKLMLKPKNPQLPIYLAAIGPKNVRLTAEIADGWLPIFYSPERAEAIYAPLLAEGFGYSGESEKAKRFDIAASVFASVTDDLDRARLEAKPVLALYIGGMGARGKNFYNDLAGRYGYEEAAHQIQELYLEGKKMEALRAVPDELVDELSLIGSKERIADRLDVWKQAGVTTLILNTTNPKTLRTLAELVL